MEHTTPPTRAQAEHEQRDLDFGNGLIERSIRTEAQREGLTLSPAATRVVALVISGLVAAGIGINSGVVQHAIRIALGW